MPRDPEPVVRVVLADDNPEIRYLTRLMVEAGPCEVVGEASTGVEAISLTEELVPDAVVIDLRMPHMNGLQATRIMRERFPDLRIIVMSGSIDPDEVREVVAAGADVAVDKGNLDDLATHLSHTDQADS